MKQISVRSASLRWCWRIAAQAQAVKVDPAIPAYQKVSGVSGTLSAASAPTR